MKIIIASFLLFLTGFTVYGQNASIPLIRTSSDSLIMYLDGQKDEFNGVNKTGPQLNYSFVVERDSSVFVLVSESDSMSITLRPGKNSVFKIAREISKDTVTCIFTTQKLVKPATFNDQYKFKNEGKTLIEIPEVYELINIIIALTEYGKTGTIYKDTEYYKLVMDHFTPYNQELAVIAVDSLLKMASDYYYPRLKMDSYVFEFSGNKIVNGGVYDRASWGERNELEYYIPILETFALKSGFRDFYKRHLNYYTDLKKDFTVNINLAGMKSWLVKQFPTTTYSATKVIFSPLVGWNQSANFFNDNGFTEAHAHVNFPFIDDKDKMLSADMLKGQRMTIVFTEINHGYINPEAEKYRKLIDSTFQDLSKWTTVGKPSSTYAMPITCFEEYMNYGLVNLYYSDIFNEKVFESLNSKVEKNMVNVRGFQRFREFNQELVRLYKNRKPGQTVADLYPAIIQWATRQGV